MDTALIQTQDERTGRHRYNLNRIERTGEGKWSGNDIKGNMKGFSISDRQFFLSINCWW